MPCRNAAESFAENTAGRLKANGLKPSPARKLSSIGLRLDMGKGKKKVFASEVLAAAEIAHEGIKWRVDEDGQVVSDDPGYGLFDPLGDTYGSGDDAFALERALKNEKNGEWVFSQPGGSSDLYKAWSRRYTSIFDKSDVLLLFKCIAHMKEADTPFDG